ncbi:tyrosine-type recombinase/integrase [Bosea sp. NBC_00550]|uniref:tyrosine-type recombinase/integrase n=1 Tax=Bosea sp. NBC_00550 TaxID=2969621 RepID=UPI002230FF12|nr:tyrosine-type recombinase/integrase [Bosea sp. NBC_00550]UZF93734.1 tyrosine-type recombinase/integrase [Bosea sp. NBC_00550]
MAKKVPALNSRQFDVWKSGTGSGQIIDGEVQGLRARRGTAGDVYWSLAVRVHGVQRRLAVGENLSLTKARDRAREMRQQIRTGVDPMAEKKAQVGRAKAARTGAGTLETVIDGYFEVGDGRELRSKSAQIEHLKTVFAGLLIRPAFDVKPTDLQAAVVAWSARSIRGAQLAAAYMRPVMRWSLALGLVQAGTDGLRAPKRRSPPLQKTMTPEDVGKFLKIAGGTGYGLAARIMLWTACRRGEVAGMTWSEVDVERGIWTIPGLRRKNTRGHGVLPDFVIALPRQMVEVLRIISRGEPNQLVVAGVDGGALVQNWPRWCRAKMTTAGVRNLSPHALRRTAATLAGELGEPPHVVEVILGHSAVGGSLVAGYNKARYKAEHAQALQRLADRLDMLATGKLDNILPMARSA